MAKTKILWISIAALSVIGVLALGLTLAAIPAIRAFAQAPTPSAAPGAPVNNTWSVYEQSFMNAFATRLGITVDKVKEAFSGAFGDTLDQVVKDGRITQAEADQMKSDFTNRLDQGNLPGFLLPFGFKRGPGFGPMGFGPKGLGEGFMDKRGGFNLASFAKALNMTEADLHTELQSGKSIATIATEKSVDLAQVKTSVLADFKTQLDQAVAAGKLVQTMADQIYNQFSTNFDTIVNQTQPMGRGFNWMH